ncbi:MAG: extracellular solute-binding protein [Nitrososphaerota archaeon]|nr:extracellular solute-binding protein [Nitrososphaerota archaeon]
MTLKNVKSITKTILAAIVIVIIIVAGVGIYYYYSSTIKPAPTTTLSGSITVAVEPGYNDAAIQQIAKNFEAAYPGTTINLADVGFSANPSAYVTAYGAGQDVYDVAYFSTAGQVGGFYQYLLPLQGYIQNTSYFQGSWNFSDIIPSTYAAYTINGNLYGIPMQSDAMLMFYIPSYFTNATNQQEFQAEYGYPLPNPGTTTYTLQELVDVANFFTHNHGSQFGVEFNADTDDGDLFETFGQIAVGIRENGSSVWGPISTTYGVPYTSNGQLLMNTSAFVTALSDYAQLTKDTEAPFTGSFGAAVNYFMVPGTSPILFSYSYPMFFLNSTLGSNWAIAPTEIGGYAMLGGEGFGIYNGTHNLNLALAFVAYATSPQQSVYYMTKDGLPPFRYSDFNLMVSDLNISPSIASVYLANLKTAVQVYANEPYESSVDSAFASVLPYVASGQITPAAGANLIETAGINAGVTPYTGTGAGVLTSQISGPQGGTSFTSLYDESSG